MPLYEYRCPNGHTHQRLRKITEREKPAACISCDEEATPILSTPHVLPDGCYSYAPNVGTMDTFDRKQHLMQKRAKARQEGKPTRWDED